MGHQGTSADIGPVLSTSPVLSARLSSWKEVAAFFRKDVRTVRRWESERGLPIHRLPGTVGKTSIFAYPAELEKWLRETGEEKEELPDLTPVTPSLLERPSAAPELHAGAVGAVRPLKVSKVEVAIVVVLAITGALSWAGWVHTRHGTVATKSGLTATQQATQSSNPEAQELYLRGRYLVSLRTGPSLTQAIDLFTQAIVHDPKFAPAYSGLADSYLLVRQFGHMTDAEAYPRALAASQQAMSLDPSLAAAHCSYAFVVNYWQWDFATAEPEFQRAIALDPKSAQAHHWYATSLFSVGRFQDALKQIDIARGLDPDSIAILASRGLILKQLDPEAALVFLLPLEKSNPQFPLIHTYLSLTYERMNDWPGYVHERGIAANLNGEMVTSVYLSAERTLKNSGIVAMNRVLAEGLGKACDEGKAGAMDPAFFYARLGIAERSLHYLNLSFSRREPGFLFLKYQPAFNFLRTNRAYQALLLQGNIRSVRPLE